MYGTAEINDSAISASTSTLRSLINSAGLYQEQVHNHNQLTLHTGVFVSDAVVQCGVSVEKFPMLLLLVLYMLFGNSIDPVYIKSIVKSSGTYDIAMRRAAGAIKHGGMEPPLSSFSKLVRMLCSFDSLKKQ